MMRAGYLFHDNLGSILNNPDYGAFWSLGENVVVAPSFYSGWDLEGLWMGSGSRPGQHPEPELQRRRHGRVRAAGSRARRGPRPSRSRIPTNSTVARAGSSRGLSNPPLCAAARSPGLASFGSASPPAGWRRSLGLALRVGLRLATDHLAGLAVIACRRAQWRDRIG